MTKKNDEIVKKSDEKNNKQDNKPAKYNLVELVEQYPLSLARLTMDLSRTGLLKQYEEECIKIKEGIPVEPSLTIEEFNKIINRGK